MRFDCSIHCQVPKILKTVTYLCGWCSTYPWGNSRLLQSALREVCWVSEPDRMATNCPLISCSCTPWMSNVQEITKQKHAAIMLKSELKKASISRQCPSFFLAEEAAPREKHTTYSNCDLSQDSFRYALVLLFINELVEFIQWCVHYLHADPAVTL